MKKIYLVLWCCCMLTAMANAQYTNVIMGTGSEVSIMMDPNNTNNLVGGANINEVFYSTDGGATWTQNSLTSSMSVWGDPVIVVDNTGNFYYFHLVNTGMDRVVCQKSTDGGATWSDGTYFGYSATTDQDKEWATIDRNTGRIYGTWADIDSYSSSNPLDSARIKISWSDDNTATWSSSVRVSVTAGNCGWKSIKGAVPAIGPNGEVYVAWCGNGVSFQKSTNNGSTWMAQDVTVDFQPDWYFTVPGMTWGNGFPSIACDVSGGSSNGNIYIAWADIRNGASNSDCFVARSIDGGNTWNTTRVNDDISNNHNFHPWVTVDQVTGNVYVVFYDRRNYTNDSGTDLYMAYSVDGGAWWANEKISQTSFTGSPWDYNNCVAHNKIVRPIWAQQSVVYTALIDHDDLPVGYDEDAFKQQIDLFQVFPNPVYDWAYVKFSIPEAADVTLKLYNMLGEEVTTVFEGQQYAKGFHEYTLDITRYNIASGLYYCTLITENSRSSVKIIVEK